MKILIFNKEEFKAEKIIKTIDSIIGKDSFGKEIFAFRGISDFSEFKLKEGESFDIEEKTEEKMLKEIANLKINNMKKDNIINNTLKTVAELKVKIMSMEGGN